MSHCSSASFLVFQTIVKQSLPLCFVFPQCGVSIGEAWVRGREPGWVTFQQKSFWSQLVNPRDKRGVITERGAFAPLSVGHIASITNQSKSSSAIFKSKIDNDPIRFWIVWRFFHVSGGHSPQNTAGRKVLCSPMMMPSKPKLEAWVRPI